MAEKLEDADDSASLVSNSIVSSVTEIPFYPLSYIKTLNQIGHEPLPSFKSTTFFGREQYYYPNSFQYCAYVYSVEGFSGLYRGLGMKLISQSVGHFASRKAARLIQEADEKQETVKKNDQMKGLNLLFKMTTNRIHSRCWGVLLSHPFHVMGVRCMAQFVGGETRYSSWNVIQNTIEIYRSEGAKGFFSGLIPRLLFEASSIALTGVIVYFVKNYIADMKEIDGFIDLIASIISNTITYPLSVISTVSCVSGTSLLAGQPPRMLVYPSWIDVFKHLYDINELNRGFSTINRIAKHPADGSIKKIEGFEVITPLRKNN